MYASLLFGGLFLWVSAPNWPVAQTTFQNDLLVQIITLFVLAGALFASSQSVRTGAQGRIGWLAALAASHLVAAALFGWMAYGIVPLNTQHALFAVIFAIHFYAGFHALLGMVFALYGIWRVLGGYVSPMRDLDLRIGARFHAYAGSAGILALVFVWQLVMLGSGGDPA